MIGGVTCHMLPHLSDVPHLHVNRPLASLTVAPGPLGICNLAVDPTSQRGQSGGGRDFWINSKLAYYDHTLGEFVKVCIDLRWLNSDFFPNNSVRNAHAKQAHMYQHPSHGRFITRNEAMRGKRKASKATP